MTTLRTTAGKSFKGVAAYLLHDKGKQSTAERVAWTDTRHTYNAEPEAAAREMARTAALSDYLQSLTDQPKTGRRLEKPVYHLVLSWHPEDKPDRAHMTAAAASALKALGMDRAQALLVAHTDGGAPHLHIVVNRVDPETGKAFSTSNDRYALSRWAKAWEKEHGLKRCTGRDDKDKPQQPRRLERQDAKAPEHDPRAAEHQAATAPPDAAKELARLQRDEWRDLTEQQKQARKSVWLRQRAESESLYKQQRAEMAAARASIEKEADAAREASRATYKPLWRDQFKKQRAEEAAFNRMGMMQRGTLYLKKFKELAPDDRGGFLAALFNGKQTMDALRKTMHQQHEQQRKAIANRQNAAGRIIRAQVWEKHQPALDALHARHTEAREHRRAVHEIERLELADRHEDARKSTRDQHQQERRDLGLPPGDHAPQPTEPAHPPAPAATPAPAPDFAKATLAERLKAMGDAMDRQTVKERQKPGRSRKGFDRERER